MIFLLNNKKCNRESERRKRRKMEGRKREQEGKVGTISHVHIYSINVSSLTFYYSSIVVAVINYTFHIEIIVLTREKNINYLNKL